MFLVGVIGTLALSAAVGALACARRAPYCSYVRDGDGPRGTVPVRAETVATGLETPWGVAFISDGVMLVTERKGRLRLVTRAGVEPEPVATIPVHAENESGLLGIALAPSFAETRQFFLYYTFTKPTGTVNRVERWVLAGDARSARPDKIILDDIKASPAHDGGRIRIGPDGMLYAGTGDARDRDLAPDVDSTNGKILRVTVDGAIPADNPWENRAGYVRGVRNVEGFDWLDSKSGTAARPGTPGCLGDAFNGSPSSGGACAFLVVADHGPSGELGRKGNDEITVATYGANLGWPDTWGCDEGDGIDSPTLAWSKAVPPGGASFYTGDKIPEWRGSLMVGVLGARHLHRVAFDREDPRRIVLHEAYFQGDPPAGLGRLRDVLMGPDGELYVTTSNCDGRGTCPADGDKILRITR